MFVNGMTLYPSWGGGCLKMGWGDFDEDVYAMLDLGMYYRAHSSIHFPINCMKKMTEKKTFAWISR